MTLFHVSGTQAVSVWRLRDGSIQAVYLTQRQYTDFAATGQGDPPGRPASDATFLWMAGGMDRYDSPDGVLPVGGYVLSNDPKVGVVLTVRGRGRDITDPDYLFRLCEASPGTDRDLYARLPAGTSALRQQDVQAIETALQNEGRL